MSFRAVFSHVMSLRTCQEETPQRHLVTRKTGPREVHALRQMAVPLVESSELAKRVGDEGNQSKGESQKSGGDDHPTEGALVGYITSPRAARCNQSVADSHA
ncbi:hypothetical protein GCM10012275_38670 [Longimycelium tulufanense]|uniref:Uncharacterized protein n=1 Tax=Longimycelium tulufanense TaxID=907463 RepID=A0A8J3FVK4_9PSEU|nr:hypothetical protein GCM10012275_38670 [Longimycelium tulufanense]